MTNVVDYQPFANGGGANVETQAQYLTDLAAGGSLVNGYAAGLAKSSQFNKVARQSSMMTAAIANFIATELNTSVLDDGVVATLTTNFTNALTALIQSASPRTLLYCGTSAGSANAQTLTPSPAITAYGVGVPGYIFLAGYTNSGALFFNISGVGSVEVRRDSPSGLVSLTSGEVNAGAMCLLRYDGTYLRLEDSQLGTAAMMNASSGTPGGVVASVTGSFTVGHAAKFSDTNGTIADGGALGTVTSVATAGLVTGGPITGAGTVTVTASTTAQAQAGTDTSTAMTPASTASAIATLAPSIAQFTALQQDVIQNYLLDTINGAWAAGQYSNGGYDAFNSDTLSGVSGTTGQTYMSASKLYSNGASGSVQISQSSGTAVGNLTNGGGLAAAFDGNTSQTDANSAYVGSNVSAGIIGKIYGTAQAVTGYNAWSATNDYGFQGNSGSITTTIQLQGSNNSTTGLDGTWTTLDTTTVNTSGVGQQTVSRSGVLPGASSYTGLRLYITSSAGMETFDVCELQFFALSAATAMTLVDSVMSPAPTSAPSKAQLMVLWKDLSGSAVLNTDFTAEITENGGTNWVMATLADSGITMGAGPYHVLTATVALSSGGTSVQYRLKTLNTKLQQVKAVGLMVQ